MYALFVFFLGNLLCQICRYLLRTEAAHGVARDGLCVYIGFDIAWALKWSFLDIPSSTSGLGFLFLLQWEIESRLCSSKRPT